MTQEQQIAEFREELDRLAAENAALRASSLANSKAEAMLAFEYDRIPNLLKTPHAIRIQRRIATTVLFGLPIVLVVGAIFGGITAYRDHERSFETQRSVSEWGDQLRDSVHRNLDH